jgi:hypothetical protein
MKPESEFADIGHRWPEVKRTMEIEYIAAMRLVDTIRGVAMSGTARTLAGPAHELIRTRS